MRMLILAGFYRISYQRGGKDNMTSVKPIRPTIVKSRRIIKAIIKEVSAPPTEEALKKNNELSKLLKKARA